MTINVRFTRRSAALLAIFGVIAALALAPITSAQATHQPANKVGAAASTSELAFLENGDTKLLLEHSLRTSRPADLLLHVTAECSLSTTVANVGSQTQEAHGQLRLYIEIESENTGEVRRVGITQHSTGPNESEDGPESEVVFCDRLHAQRTQFADDQDHEIEQHLATRTANAFNWVALNTGNGIHHVRLYATYQAKTTAGALATGAIGNRSMIIEPVKMKNDAHVDELNT